MGKTATAQSAIRFEQFIKARRLSRETMIEQPQKTRSTPRHEDARYHKLYEFAPVAYVSLDRDGSVRAANRAGSALLGLGPDSPPTPPFSDFVLENDRQAFSLFLDRCFDGGDGNSLDLTLRPNGQAPVFMRAHGRAQAVDGECLLVLVDMSERRGCEDSLKLRESQLAEFVKHAPAAIAMFDNELRHVCVTDRWLDSFDLAGQELAGRHLGEVLPELAAIWKQACSNCQAGEVERAREHRLEGNDGGFSCLNWEIRPWYDPRGVKGGVIVFCEDVTENKRLNDLKDHVERLSRHDLLTPLSSIISVARAFSNDSNLTQDQREMLKSITVSGRRMQDMINLSLSLFMMELGRYQPTPVQVDLAKVFREVATHLRGLLEAQNVTLEMTIDGWPMIWEDSFPVMGEELLCYSLLANLIKNAIEASPRGGTVAVSLERTRGCRIGIRNTGEVPTLFRSDFFEKYATCGKKGGTGLGTYSARLMARTMGGEVELDCSQKGATTVNVRLPVEGATA